MVVFWFAYGTTERYNSPNFMIRKKAQPLMHSSRDLIFSTEKNIDIDIPIKEKILDIKLYKDNKTTDILIGFDLISSRTTDIMKLPLQLNHYLDQIFLNPIKYAGDHYNNEDRYFKKLFDNSNMDEKTFESTKPTQSLIAMNNSSCILIKSSVIYKFPTDPYTALNWIAAFTYCLKKNYRDYTVLVTDYTKKQNIEDFVKGLASIPHHYNKKNPSYKAYLNLIIRLKSMENNNENDPYYYTLMAIKKIYQHFKNDRDKDIYMDFNYYLQKDIRSLLLRSIDFNNIESAIKWARQSIRHDHKNKFKKLLETQNQYAIARLYSTAIGKASPNHRLYHWAFTEFDFLIYARFKLTPKNKLEIIDINNNQGYLDYYAKGKIGENVFEAELIHLANVLGLKFDKKNFKKHGLVFDKKSTDKLLAHGIICVDSLMHEVKKTIYAQNFWTMFNPVRNEINKPGKGTNILNLHRDSLQLIQEEMEYARIAPR